MFNFILKPFLPIFSAVWSFLCQIYIWPPSIRARKSITFRFLMWLDHRPRLLADLQLLVNIGYLHIIILPQLLMVLIINQQFFKQIAFIECFRVHITAFVPPLGLAYIFRPTRFHILRCLNYLIHFQFFSWSLIEHLLIEFLLFLLPLLKVPEPFLILIGQFGHFFLLLLDVMLVIKDILLICLFEVILSNLVLFWLCHFLKNMISFLLYLSPNIFKFQVLFLLNFTLMFL